MSDGRTIRLWLAAALLATLASCGQKGPLYLPDQAREVVTRPAATAPDSPDSPDTQAPDGKPDKDKKEPDSTAPR